MNTCTPRFAGCVGEQITDTTNVHAFTFTYKGAILKGLAEGQIVIMAEPGTYEVGKQYHITVTVEPK